MKTLHACLQVPLFECLLLALGGSLVNPTHAATAGSCDLTVRLDAVMVSSNRQAVGFPPLLNDPQDPTIFFVKHVRQEDTIANSCYVCHESGQRDVSDVYRYDPMTSEGPALTEWSGSLRYRAETNGQQAFACASTRLGPTEWSDPACGFSFAPPLHIVVSNRTQLAYTLVTAREVHELIATSRGTAVQDISERRETRIEMHDPLALSDFLAEATAGLNAAPWPSWKTAARYGLAERGGRNVLSILNDDRAEFRASLTKLKYRLAVRGPLGQKRLVTWVERFTPNGGGPVLDTPFAEEITCTGREQFVHAAGGEDGKVVWPPQLTGQLEVLLLGPWSCPNDDCAPGRGKVATGSLEVSISLGQTPTGESAGYLALHEERPDPALADPERLHPFVHDTVEVLRDGPHVRQLRAPQTLVLIVPLTDGYEVRFHAEDAGKDPHGFYLAVGQPQFTWRFESPGRDPAKLRVTQLGGSSPMTNEFHWSVPDVAWALVMGNLRKEIRSTTHTNGLRYERFIIREPDDRAVYQEDRAWRQDAVLGDLLLTHQIGSADNPLLTEWTYYSDATDNAFGKVQSVTYANGARESFAYDAMGRIRLQTSDYGLTPNGRVLEYSYVPFDPEDDGARQPNEPRLIIERVFGHEIGRRYRSVREAEILDMECPQPGAAWDDPHNLVTITRSVTRADTEEVTETVQHPDGTLQISRGASPRPGQPRVESIVFGAPNQDHSAVVDGTRTETAFDGAGRILSRTTQDVRSGTYLERETYRYADPFGPATEVTYLDGSAITMTYDCCHLISERDRDGVLTTYTYDPLGRRITATRNGVTHLYSYDAAHNLVLTRRQGTNGSFMIVHQAAYDLAGRQVQSADGLTNITRILSQPHPNGGTLHTTSFPDGGHRAEWMAPDGNLIEISGSAAEPVRYTYGVETIENTPRLFTLETTRTHARTDTGQWVKTYSDSAGRPWRIVRSNGATSEFFYNPFGQLRKQRGFDGRITLFAYNQRGELEYTALDANNSDSIDLAGLDRVTRTVRDVANGREQTRTEVWPAAGANTAVLTSTRAQTPDGLFQSSERFGLATSRKSERLGHDTVRITDTAADGTKSVRVLHQGQLRLRTRTGSGGETLEATAYAYDAHGRLATVTDAYTGLASSYEYDGADRIIRQTSPAPAAGPPSLTTWQYDGLGRVTRTIFPDGAVQTNLYTATGRLRTRFGARTYPMERGYDAQGRLTNLTTWSRSGPVSTSWTYDHITGWLMRKTYPDGAGLSFTRTPIGTLATLASGQGTRNYRYNILGDLEALTRSPSDPHVRFLDLDRLGRPHRVEFGTNVTSLTYHQSGLVLSETFHSFQVSNTVNSVLLPIDLMLNRTAAAAPLFTHSFLYDGAARVREIKAGSLRVIYNYLTNSSLLGEVLLQHHGALRMVSTRTYDAGGHLTQIASAPAAAPALLFDYRLNLIGQRTNVTATDGTWWSYRYDPLGQLISGRRYWLNGTTVPGHQFEYVFDHVGNRLAIRVGGDNRGAGLWSFTYSPNRLNQYDSRNNPAHLELLGQAPPQASVLLNDNNPTRYGHLFHLSLPLPLSAEPLDVAVSARARLSNDQQTNAGHVFMPPRPEPFLYDLDGNLREDARWTYTWDADSRLVGLEAHSKLPASARLRLAFTYDFRGRRLSKTVWGWVPDRQEYQLIRCTRFVYDRWRLLAEVDEKDQLIRSYVWGPDLGDTRDGAGGAGGLVATIDHVQGRVLGHAYDGQGNVCALVDLEQGTIVARYEYGPFGELLRATGPQARENPFRFSTKYHDHETGLVYYGHRYYSPSIGRWLSRDPIGEQGGLGLYGFLDNSPVNSTDALGLRAEVPKRSLEQYRFCRRTALTAKLLRGGVGPGDYQRDCCQLITVLVKLPLCTGTGLDAKGLGGHTGVGIDAEYYDYGPDVANERGLNTRISNTLTGIPGFQWWDDPERWVGATTPDDVNLADVLARLPDLAQRDGMPLDVFRIELAVTAEQAQKIRAYWQNRYQNLGTFRALGEQCTTAVMNSLDQADVFPRPFLTFKPSGFLKSLASARHTCGPNQGQRVRLEQLNREQTPASCRKP